MFCAQSTSTVISGLIKTNKQTNNNINNRHPFFAWSRLEISTAVPLRDRQCNSSVFPPWRHFWFGAGILTLLRRGENDGINCVTSEKYLQSTLDMIDWLIDDCLYSAILRSRADSLRSHVILREWLAFYSAFFWISTEVVYLQRWHGWCHMKLLPSRRKFCVHHATMSLQAKPHT